MALEIKIECGVGEESAIISELLPILTGRGYEIRVTPPAASRTRLPPLSSKSESRGEQGASDKGTRKLAIKPRLPGLIKRTILESHATDAAIYHTQEAIQKATGYTADQVRSATADAVTRKELDRKTVGDVHKHRITEHGLSRLKEAVARK